MAVTGWTGAAAITTALALLGGPFGMLGGIAVLGIMRFVSQGIAQYGFPEIFKAVVYQLYTNGMSKESILKEVSWYPISDELKKQISDYL